jgi:hypothetical protein
LIVVLRNLSVAEPAPVNAADPKNPASGESRSEAEARASGAPPEKNDPPDMTLDLSTVRTDPREATPLDGVRVAELTDRRPGLSTEGVLVAAPGRG